MPLMPVFAQTLPDQRLYAIGDLHGRLDLLEQLLPRIEADAARYPDKDKKLIFLGDYIDRGLDSRGVIERLLRPFGSDLAPVFLRGNHDDMLLQFLAGESGLLESWLQLGGASTLSSYGVNSFGALGNPEALRRELLAKVPEAHRSFLESTLFSATFGGYTFVHAGLRPGVAMEEQTKEDKLWIRGDFLFANHKFETFIIHGHTIKDEPEAKAGRIGIDTGAFATGHLTCLLLDGSRRAFLST